MESSTPPHHIAPSAPNNRFSIPPLSRRFSPAIAKRDWDEIVLYLVLTRSSNASRHTLAIVQSPAGVAGCKTSTAALITDFNLAKLLSPTSICQAKTHPNNKPENDQPDHSISAQSVSMRHHLMEVENAEHKTTILHLPSTTTELVFRFQSKTFLKCRTW